MDGAEALRHLCKWLGEEAALPLEVLTGLEKKLAEEQVFQVEDLMLLRDEGMLQTVFSKHVTRHKVEMALEGARCRRVGSKRACSGQAVGGRLASGNGRRRRAAVRRRLRRRASCRSRRSTSASRSLLAAQEPALGARSSPATKLLQWCGCRRLCAVFLRGLRCAAPGRLLCGYRRLRAGCWPDWMSRGCAHRRVPLGGSSACLRLPRCCKLARAACSHERRCARSGARWRSSWRWGAAARARLVAGSSGGDRRRRR